VLVRHRADDRRVRDRAHTEPVARRIRAANERAPRLGGGRRPAGGAGGEQQQRALARRKGGESSLDPVFSEIVRIRQIVLQKSVRSISSAMFLLVRIDF